MYLAFSCNYTFALKVDGIYKGIYEKTTKYFELNNSPFIEICPLNGNVNSICFLVDNNFLNIQNDKFIITNLLGGYLITFIKPTFNNCFNIICQKKFQFATFTLFADNGYKLSIESKNDFYAQEFFSEITVAEIKQITINGKNLFCVITFNNEQKNINIFDIDNKITRIFTQEFDEYSFENSLVLTKNFSDIAKHKIKYFYTYKNGKIIEENKEILFDKNFNFLNKPNEIIPYCMLESIIVGENIDRYLCEKLLKNKDKLLLFLNNFIGFFPPPIFRKENEIGLLYKQNENNYYVNYFIFEISEKLINNIKKMRLKSSRIYYLN